MLLCVHFDAHRNFRRRTAGVEMDCPWICVELNLHGARALMQHPPALSTSIWALKFGESGLFSAPYLTDLYREASMTT